MRMPWKQDSRPWACCLRLLRTQALALNLRNLPQKGLAHRRRLRQLQVLQVRLHRLHLHRHRPEVRRRSLEGLLRRHLHHHLQANRIAIVSALKPKVKPLCLITGRMSLILYNEALIT